MPAAAPKPQREVHEHHVRARLYASEATGLLIVAILVLILTLIRYWRYIPWMAR